MKRVFSIFFCVLLLFSLTIPVFAGNTIVLMYEPWLFFYDLADSDENHSLWLGMYSYGGTEELYPIHIDEDAYNAKLAAAESSGDDESEVSGDAELDPDKPDLSDADSVSDDLLDNAAGGHLEDAAISSGTQSSISESPVLFAANVPTSGQSYIMPEVVDIEYAPDASSGSLLAVLYGLLGKPVVSYTYKVQTNSSQSYTGYVTQHLEYDANWISSLVLLLVVLFCIFKAGGALLCKA